MLFFGGLPKKKKGGWWYIGCRKWKITIINRIEVLFVVWFLGFDFWGEDIRKDDYERRKGSYSSVPQWGFYKNIKVIVRTPREK